MDNVLPIYWMHAEPSKSIISQSSTSQAAAPYTAALQSSRLKHSFFSTANDTGSSGLYKYKSRARLFMALYALPLCNATATAEASA